MVRDILCAEANEPKPAHYLHKEHPNAVAASNAKYVQREGYKKGRVTFTVFRPQILQICIPVSFNSRHSTINSHFMHFTAADSNGLPNFLLGFHKQLTFGRMRLAEYQSHACLLCSTSAKPT